ncbi:MAG: hypothetical protein AB8E74_02975 [Prochlorococcus sp.]|nr:hypothetical protein [Prochlorococcaceae cyanobacterium Fu_MAG_50]
MVSTDPGSIPLPELIAQLDEDRAWLLEQIDRGRWSDLRLDLAALERELGQLLSRAVDVLEENSKLRS